MNEKEFLKFIQALKNTLKCPLCGRTYAPEEVKLLGMINSAHLLEMNCSSCELTVMATVVLSPQKTKLDLISNNPLAENEDSGITNNELVQLHAFMKDFDGDFKALFDSRQKTD